MDLLSLRADNVDRWGKEVRHEVLAFGSLALFLLVTPTFMVATTTDANAVVCAKGVYRAGCAGPRGAVVAHRAPRGIYMRARRY